MNFKNVKNGTVTAFEKTVKGFWLRNPFYKKNFDIFEGSTISSLKVTFQNIVFDKTYYVDKNMINVTILQEN